MGIARRRVGILPENDGPHLGDKTNDRGNGAECDSSASA